MLAIRSYAKNFAMVASGDVKSAAIIEGQCPDVFSLRIEVNGRFPIILTAFACGRPARRPTSGGGFQFVDLSIWIRGCIEHSILRHHQRLDLQLLRLEDC